MIEFKEATFFSYRLASYPKTYSLGLIINMDHLWKISSSSPPAYFFVNKMKSFNIIFSSSLRIKIECCSDLWRWFVVGSSSCQLHLYCVRWAGLFLVGVSAWKWRFLGTFSNPNISHREGGILVLLLHLKNLFVFLILLLLTHPTTIPSQRSHGKAVDKMRFA